MLDDNDVLQLDYLKGGVGSLSTFLSTFPTIFFTSHRYNNFQTFLMKNIEKPAFYNEFSLSSKKNSFAVDIGTWQWIIKNEKTKVFMLVHEFIKRVTSTFFYFDALKNFGITLNSKK